MTSISTMIRRYYLALFLAIPAFAQVAVTPSVIPHITFVNSAGAPCSGCSLFSYSAGTTTPLATYSDATGGPLNTNPIILDTAGGANIWVGNNSYKFVLKDALGNTIWSVDQVNAGSLFPCASAGAIQVANSATTGLTCDPTITINTSTHTINVGTLPSNHVTIGALGTPTAWTFDTTTPATACASLGCGGVNAGTLNQLAYYAAAGTAVSGTSAIPAGITATTQAPGDNSTLPATTAYVALPGPINPSSIQIGAGVAMTDNQGNGAMVQHSTGVTISGHGALFDANGNIIDSGVPLPVVNGTDQYISFAGPNISGSGGVNNISSGIQTTSFSPVQPDSSYVIVACSVVNSTGATDFVTITSILSASSFRYDLQQVQNNGGNTFSTTITCHLHHP